MKLIQPRRGFDDEKSAYQGPPSPAVDQNWDDLFGMICLSENLSLDLTSTAEFGASRIDRATADQLINRTSEIPGDPGHYLTALDVFHQLHCLNR